MLSALEFLSVIFCKAAEREGQVGKFAPGPHCLKGPHKNFN